VMEIQGMPVNSVENLLRLGLGCSQVAHHPCKTGLASIAANPPELPHRPAPGLRSPPSLSTDPYGLWPCNQAPRTPCILAQNHDGVLGDCLSSRLQV